MRESIVIGAGFAGLMGALALAEAGRRPLVLAKGQGTTHWTGGTIDLWGAAGDTDLRTAVQSVIDARPEHPYARAGVAGIEAAIARFQGVVETAHYPYVGSLKRNLLLPTALGALRPAAFVPVTMAAGDMRIGGEILIAGFRELRDFFPPMAAANLRAQGFDARAIYLEVPPGGRRIDYSPRTFALLFDDPSFRQQIGKQLRRARSAATTRIGLPAVLGLHAPLGTIHDLQRISGAQIFEIPTLPPSVPGMRLFAIFSSAIARAGGRVQIGSEVVRGVAANGSLTAVWSEAAAHEQEHRSRRFLLATGGIAGGGVRTDHTGAVWETALGLPLQAPDGRGGWFAGRFFDPGGHPIFQAGVVTDAALRPLDAGGQVVYPNVAVAGAALAGADTVRERCASGVAIATGWKAGQVLSSE